MIYSESDIKIQSCYYKKPRIRAVLHPESGLLPYLLLVPPSFAASFRTLKRVRENVLKLCLNFSTESRTCSSPRIACSISLRPRNAIPRISSTLLFIFSIPDSILSRRMHTIIRRLERNQWPEISTLQTVSCRDTLPFDISVSAPVSGVIRVC